MKKIIYLFTIFICIIFIGNCINPTDVSGPDDPEDPPVSNSLKGYIVDQAGVAVSGLTVFLNDSQTVTAADGKFSFKDISTGRYELSGKGGVDGHYMVSPITVNIVSGQNNLGNIIAYRIQGVGAVIQNTQSMNPAMSLGLNASYKAIDSVYMPDKKALIYSAYKNESALKAASEQFLAENPSFIQIKWENLIEDWINHYIVYYLGPEGEPLAEPVSVWDSDDSDSHPEDEPFDINNPISTLDLGNELSDPEKVKITEPGRYDFQVVGFDAQETQEKALPTITVSLGMILESYPVLFPLDGNTLSWQSTSGAHGYRVLIKQEDTLVWDSGKTPLLTQTDLTVPSEVNSGIYYFWYVDAHVLDEVTGYSIEVTRGISGFELKD